MFIRTEKSIQEFIRYYPVVSLLVIINLALWAIVDILPSALGGPSLFEWGAGHNYSVFHFGEYWRLLTPIFLHAGLMHALFNSFALVLFGPALEQMLGKYKFIIAYILAGVAGNLGTYFVDITSTIVHIGASGSVYGLFGIYVFMVLFRKHLIDPANSQIILTIFLIGLVMTFIQPGINIYAHIFGFIGGFAIGPIALIHAEPFSIYRNIQHRPTRNTAKTFDPNRWNNRRKQKKLPKNLLWIVIGILAILGLFSRFL